MTDEIKLLKKLKKKQRNSLETAIKIYTPYISVILFNMAGNRLPPEDIEEIVSDVFIALWRNAEHVDLEKGTIRSYIGTIAKNLAKKKLKKQVDYISIEDIEIPDKNDLEISFDKNNFNEFLWKSVMNLGEPDSEIFVRYYKYGEKIKDISKTMGINISTVKTKLSRGKQKLKKVISDTEGLL